MVREHPQVGITNQASADRLNWEASNHSAKALFLVAATFAGSIALGGDDVRSDFECQFSYGANLGRAASHPHGGPGDLSCPGGNTLRRAAIGHRHPFPAVIVK